MQPSAAISRKNSHAANREPVLDIFQRPLRHLRISVTDQCNLHCCYCRPYHYQRYAYPFIKYGELLNVQEILRLSRILIRMGVHKIRITGGEPLLRPDLIEIISGLSRLPGLKDLSMTTNGLLLKAMARNLKKAGLHRLTVSLDSIRQDGFSKMCGPKASVSQVLEGIESACGADFQRIKINAVLLKGMNDRDVLELVGHFKGSGHILRFIEYMDAGTCHPWREESVVPNFEVYQLIHKNFPLKALDSRNEEVARRYEFADGSGEIGFISSVTQPFCRDCTRIRISPEGKIYPCLFSEKGHDFKSVLQQGWDDNELEDLIRRMWHRRDDRYSENRMLFREWDKPRNKPEMYQIGG